MRLNRVQIGLVFVEVDMKHKAGGVWLLHSVALRVSLCFPGAKILVCGAEAPEAVSTGFILQQMVQRNLRTFTFLVRESSQVSSSSATFALVILSRQILADESFAQTLLALRRLATLS